MWTLTDRAWVGDFGSGQVLSDDQYCLIEPLIPRAKPGAAADHRHAPLAGWPVLSRADRLPVAPSTASSGFSAMVHGLQILPRVHAS